MRHTTFRYTLQPSPEQAAALARHAGAARYAYNQCLALVRQGLDRSRLDPTVQVPWSGYDLINAFNAWKRSPAAGRRFVASPDGTVMVEVTGLVWRQQVVAQVFEEAAVDLGRALKAYRDSRTGERAGRRVGFPRWKKKGCCRDSFRVRNNGSGMGRIRVGEEQPRSVRLPRLDAIRVVEDTLAGVG
jgi:putative transposase